MSFHRHRSPADFGDVARRVYGHDPVRYTLELTTLLVEPHRDGRVLASVTRNGVAGAVVEGREGCLLVSGLPSQLAGEMATALVSTDVTAARGNRCSAMAFALSWTAREPVVTRNDVLYRLADLMPPTGVGGAARLAASHDDDLLVDWLREFLIDAHASDPELADGVGLLRDTVRADARILVWMVDGAPVSMARVHAPAGGAARIGPVYTPPECRGHGYAAAVTVAAVELAWRRGARDVVLFADATNPVSNRVYRRIGFTPVTEHVEVILSSPTSSERM